MTAPTPSVPWYDRPSGIAARTCAWTCATTGGLAVVGVLLWAVVVGDSSDGGVFVPIAVLAWAVVAVLTWVVGWPVGLLAEHLLARGGASDALRVLVLAGAGAGIAALLTSGFLPDLTIVFTVVGGLGAGTGRGIVVARGRRFRPVPDEELEDAAFRR